ncbi:hypothetical protein GCM10011344_00100 [Dokdonia pacifica]|nr:hypothetical protein GCM10011344_00100 [Dokdonia pacifica]
MLVSFWSDFSLLNYDDTENNNSIKKSLRVVGIGNLISGLFGVMPSNISFIDSFSIRVFGKTTWVSKLPIIIILLIIAIVGIPDFNVPMYAFAGMLIYIGVLMVIKSWKILKDLHSIDYIFTILIGLIIILSNYTIGFIFAIGYALIFHLIISQKEKHQKSKTPDHKE